MSRPPGRGPEEALLQGAAGRETSVWQKIPGRVPGPGSHHSVGPDLNLAEEIRLPGGWSRCAGPSLTLSVPPPQPPQRKRMNFSSIYWKAVATAVVRGQG